MTSTSAGKSSRISDTVRSLAQSSFNTTLPTTAPAWVPDDEVENCMLCFVSFTMFNRRHHCRNCGFIVCNSCSLRRHVLQHVGPSPSRVCDRCVVDLGINSTRSSSASLSSSTVTSPGLASPTATTSRTSILDKGVFVTAEGHYLPPVSTVSSIDAVQNSTAVKDSSKPGSGRGGDSTFASQALGVLDVPAWTYAVKPFTSHGPSVRIGRCLVRVVEAKNIKLPGLQASAKTLEELSFSEDCPFQFNVAARVDSGSGVRTAFSQARSPHFRNRSTASETSDGISARTNVPASAKGDSGLDLINAYLDEETALVAAGIQHVALSNALARSGSFSGSSTIMDTEDEIVANCEWKESLILDVSSSAETLRFDVYCFNETSQAPTAASTSGKSTAGATTGTSSNITSDQSLNAPRSVASVGHVSLPLFSIASQKRYRLWLRLDTVSGATERSTNSDLNSIIVDAPSDESSVPALCVEVQYIYNSLGFLWSQVSSPDSAREAIGFDGKQSGLGVHDDPFDDLSDPALSSAGPNNPMNIALRNQAIVSKIAAPRQFSITQFLHDYFYFLYHFQFIWHFLDLSSGVLLWRLPLVTVCVVAVTLYVTFNPWAPLVLMILYTLYHLWEGSRAASGSSDTSSKKQSLSKMFGAFSKTPELIEESSGPSVSPQEVDMLASLGQSLLPTGATPPGSSFRVNGVLALPKISPTTAPIVAATMPLGMIDPTVGTALSTTGATSVSVPPIPSANILANPGAADRALLAVLTGMLERLLPLCSEAPVHSAFMSGKQPQLLTLSRVAEFFQSSTKAASSFWSIFQWSNPTLSLSVTICLVFWLFLALIGLQTPLWFLLIAAPLIVRSQQFRLQTQALRGLIRWATAR